MKVLCDCLIPLFLSQKPSSIWKKLCCSQREPQTSCASWNVHLPKCVLGCPPEADLHASFKLCVSGNVWGVIFEPHQSIGAIVLSFSFFLWKTNQLKCRNLTMNCRILNWRNTCTPGMTKTVIHWNVDFFSSPPPQFSSQWTGLGLVCFPMLILETETELQYLQDNFLKLVTLRENKYINYWKQSIYFHFKMMSFWIHFICLFTSCVYKCRCVHAPLHTWRLEDSFGSWFSPTSL